MHPIHSGSTARKATNTATLALVTLTLLAAACSDASAPDLSTQVRDPQVASLGKSSSGGARIAFASDRDTPTGSEIYTVNSNGTGVTRLTFTVSATNTSPAWSPDRKRIAFMSTRTDGLGEIYVMNADGSYLTRLTYSVGADLTPAWSHDGKRIAFASSRDGDVEIYVMNADGSDQRRLTDSPGTDEFPSWSPDGKRIAFISRRQEPASSAAELYVMNADGTNPTPVTALAAILALPTWVPGGKQIAFSDVNGISVIGVDGTGLTPVVADGVDPTYSPDGKSIAFTSSRDGNFEIYTANADGSAQTRITFENASSYRPAWGR
jgi:Tol biopolymer transport system component